MSTPGELLEALGRQARGLRGNGGDTGVRTYRGRSVDELIPVIQRELGPEAIVVRRREGLTGGVLGFFQRAFVEIEAMPGAPRVDVYDEQHSASPAATAGSLEAGPTASALCVDSPAPAALPTPSALQTPAMQQPPPAQPPPVQQSPQPSRPVDPAEPARPGLGYLPRQPSPLVAPASTAAQNQTVPPASSASPAMPFYTRDPVEPPATAPAPGSAYVTAHLAALARADRSRGTRHQTPPRMPAAEPASNPVEPLPWSNDYQELVPSDVPELFPPTLARAPAPVAATASTDPGPAAPRLSESGERRVVAPGSHSRARTGVAKSLQRYGISDQLAHELIDGASAHALALAPRAGLAQAVRMTLAQRIPVAPPLPTKGAAIVVVGAGGAGKTTCCVALLGAYRKSSSLPASFATIAREGERAELRMILSPHIVKPVSARAPRALRALRRARGDGMAVLDTPNLSPSDRAGIRELAGLLGELKPERVVVALPATLGAAAAAQLLQALRPLGANSLAVTHADETDQIGVAVEAACRFGLAPEYVLDRGRGGGWRLSRVDPAGLAARLLQ